MEIDGPMASLYLLGNPDHYTSHKFIAVYWKNYIQEVMKEWRSEENLETEKVVIQKSSDKYVGFSSVHDYIYRSKEFEHISLYKWIQMTTRVKLPKKYQIDDESKDIFDIISDTEIDISDDESTKNTINQTKFYLFKKDHSLYRTHRIDLIIKNQI